MIVFDKTYDPLLKSWMNVVGKPGNANALNRCVKSLRNAGILAELDLFHLIGGLDTDVQRLRPLVTTSTTKTFTAVSSPTLAYNGVTGNGSTSYIDTNWVASAHSVKYTLNNAHFGAYFRTEINAGDGVGVLDGTSRCYIRPRNAGALGVTINTNTAAGSAVVPSSKGFSVLARAVSTTELFIKNGTQVNSASNNTVALPTRSLWIGGLNNVGVIANASLHNVSMFSTGSSNINQLKFYQIIQAYMADVGLAV